MKNEFNDAQQKQIAQFCLSNPSMSASKVARLLGVSKDSVLKYGKRQPSLHAGASEEDVITEDTRTITLPKTPIHTLEQLVKACEIDLSEWEVERFVCKKWDMGYKDASDKGQAIALFSVAAYMRRKRAVVDAKAELEALKEDARLSAPRPKALYPAPIQNGNMLEVSLFDAHFGKLAWSRETAGPNYDLAIAETIYVRALDSLIERSKGHKYERVLFPVGQDLLNSDNLEGKTTRGTQVSTDGRFQKMFRVARRVMVESIEKLRAIAPVLVVVVPGNHDAVTSWCLGDSLECYFHNYSDVEVNNEPTPRKYVQFGKVMVMFCHGDKGRRIEYPLIMATEMPEMFGATQFREIHTGHLHQTKLDEKHGVRVRILPSLSPADAWHAENGFVGNQRMAEAYAWNKDQGLVAQYFYNDGAFPEVSTKRVIRKGER